MYAGNGATVDVGGPCSPPVATTAAEGRKVNAGMTVTSSKNVNTAALVAAIPLDVATPRMIVMKGGGNEAFHSVRINPENENVLIGETRVGGHEVRLQLTAIAGGKDLPRRKVSSAGPR